MNAKFSPTKVAVLGSINMDLVIRCSNLPRPGETVLGKSSEEVCGGKGANQAVQAALMGGRVAMIGRVGDDVFADRLLANLQQRGVDVSCVHKTPRTSSGLAIVCVENGGENSIVVVPGANGRVVPEDVDAASETIQDSDVLLVQLEIPIAAVLRGIELAKAAGVRVILDPAPAIETLPLELLDVDLICPNRHEAEQLLRQPIDDRRIENALTELRSLGPANIVVTLGDRGLLYTQGDAVVRAPPFHIDAVDSTASGDAFAGALAVAWSQGRRLQDAIPFANAAGAIAASRSGAQPSMGSRQEIQAMVEG